MELIGALEAEKSTQQKWKQYCGTPRKIDKIEKIYKIDKNRSKQVKLGQNIQIRLKVCELLSEPVRLWFVEAAASQLKKQNG